MLGNRLSIKLFLVLLVTATVAAGVALGLTRHSIGRGFQAYLEEKQQNRLAELAQTLAEDFSRHGRWDFLYADPGHWRRLVEGDEQRPPHGPPVGRPFPPSWGDPPPPPGDSHFPGLARGATIFNDHRQPLLGPETSLDGLVAQAVTSLGKIVGWVGARPLPSASTTAEQRFLEGQRRAWWLIGLATLLLAGLMAALLTRRLLQPIRDLAAGARQLAKGRFATRLVVHSQDEIGRLTQHFNHLAVTLEANEAARRRWIADISHELRTPLAILRGEIEALQDGVRHAGPEAWSSLHAEAMRLTRLVEDLYQLSLSDLGALNYHFEPTDLAALLEDALDGFRPRFRDAGIRLTFERPERRFPINADPRRLTQLFHNLLKNSLRYTDRGGQLRLLITRQDQRARVDCQDSAPGVPPEALPRLFDRLYRAEGSRNRATGGAGLGLAIAHNIAAAHQGTLEARPSPLGGVWIILNLPLLLPE